MSRSHRLRFRAGALVLLGLFPLAAPAAAAVFTVGTAGDHATLESALDAALAAGGSNEIRIQLGFHYAVVTIPATFSGSLTVTGGWDFAFATRNSDPALTGLDADGFGRVLTVAGVETGSIRFEGLTFSGGVEEQGGGISVDLRGNAVLELVESRIEGNVASGADAQGGGLWAYLQDDSHLRLEDSLVTDNTVQGAGVVEGGGLFMTCSEDSTFAIRRNRIEANRAVSSAESGRSAGFAVTCMQEGSGELLDNVIAENEGAGVGQSYGYGASIGLLATGGGELPPTGTIVASRNLFLDNRYTDPAGFADHLNLATQGPAAQILISDSVIAGGNRLGPGVTVTAGGTIRLTNVTITGHGATGLFDYRLAGGLPPAGTFSLFNSIVSGNAVDTDLTPFVQSGFNLIAGNPLFVDAAGNDLHLAVGSPAIDAGTDTPPGGLSSRDADSLARVAGAAVDLGAYEHGSTPLPEECIASATVLCLAEGRFGVELGWETVAAAGVGQAVALTGDTGYFWFFSAANVEVVVKVLNACATFDRFWVFAAGLTNVAVEITVTDTATGAVRTYENARGTAFAPLQDTAAFATCP